MAARVVWQPDEKQQMMRNLMKGVAVLMVPLTSSFETGALRRPPRRRIAHAPALGRTRAKYRAGQRARPRECVGCAGVFVYWTTSNILTVTQVALPRAHSRAPQLCRRPQPRSRSKQPCSAVEGTDPPTTRSTSKSTGRPRDEASLFPWCSTAMTAT